MTAKWPYIALAAALWVGTFGSLNPAVAGPAGHAAAAIWANDQLYDTVLTDTSFKSPPPQSTDVIFNFADSGLSGQRSVSESAPGDPNYNGGRWRVMAVTFYGVGNEHT